MKILRGRAWQAKVGERLVLAREAVGRKQAPFARSLGITPQRLSNYESGSRPLDIDIALLIADRHGITLDYLYRGEIAGLRYDIAEKVAPIPLPPGAPRN